MVRETHLASGSTLRLEEKKKERQKGARESSELPRVLFPMTASLPRRGHSFSSPARLPSTADNGTEQSLVESPTDDAWVAQILLTRKRPLPRRNVLLLFSFGSSENTTCMAAEDALYWVCAGDANLRRSAGAGEGRVSRKGEEGRKRWLRGSLTHLLTD